MCARTSTTDPWGATASGDHRRRPAVRGTFLRVNDSDEKSGRGWRIDLGEPPESVSGDVVDALDRVSAEFAAFGSGTSGEGGEKAAALRGAARLGAGEHRLAVASGLTREGVRAFLAGE
ncbi:hypothetical protein C5C27_12810 [Rathayibacter sp. AY2B7]|nr:hypothetical protein C5C27_12810 [Rathayibacter sp. AY2B7]